MHAAAIKNQAVPEGSGSSIPFKRDEILGRAFSPRKKAITWTVQLWVSELMVDRVWAPTCRNLFFYHVPLLLGGGLKSVCLKGVSGGQYPIHFTLVQQK